MKLYVHIPERNVQTILAAVAPVKTSSVDFLYSIFTCSMIEVAFNGWPTALLLHLLFVHHVLATETWILNSLYLTQHKQDSLIYINYRCIIVITHKCIKLITIYIYIYIYILYIYIYIYLIHIIIYIYNIYYNIYIYI